MEYLKIGSTDEHTSEVRCKLINSELWKISQPIDRAEDVTDKVFNEVPLLDGSFALNIDTSFVINVHPDNNVANLATLFPELDENEKAMLVGYISQSASFAFGAIIPQGTKVYTAQELINENLLNEAPLL